MHQHSISQVSRPTWRMAPTVLRKWMVVSNQKPWFLEEQDKGWRLPGKRLPVGSHPGGKVAKKPLVLHSRGACFSSTVASVWKQMCYFHGCAPMAESLFNLDCSPLVFS
jgi:hypothetical protein